jgi:hypothetical protein
MFRTHLAVLAATSALALVVFGCGGSSKSSTSKTASSSTQASTGSEASGGGSPAPTGTLTPAQLIAKGNAICYRLNARRSSIVVATPHDYERLVPPLAAYELASAAEMSKLTPPPSMAADWRRIVAGSRLIALATGRFRKSADAGNAAKSRPLDAMLTKGIDELTSAAKHAGLSECAHFA